MKCEVCSAPALPVGGSCVFCHAPLGDGAAPPGLLDYLAERLPGADTKRSGLFRRGRVRELAVTAGGEVFKARLRGGRLRVIPESEAGAWVDRLLAAVTEDAASDVDLRAALSRAGWAHRRR